LFLAVTAIGALAVALFYLWQMLTLRGFIGNVPPPTTLGVPQQDAIPAFYGAEGAGALAVGGRGGRVIEVTTLADGGPGSLRQAIEMRGPRIVVFRVAGTIHLNNPLYIDEPHITIAGHTAPGGGITLEGSNNAEGEMIVIREVHDVIIRYLHIRSARIGEPGQGQINIAIDGGAHNVIIDHVSLSWALDENVMIHRNIPSGADVSEWPEISNITLQRSIMSEGFWPHSTGTQTGGEAISEGYQGVYDLTIHHNLYANNSHRNPGLGSTHTQVINNVVYNWLARVGSTWRNISVDWIGNTFKPGPMSDDENLLVHVGFPNLRPDQPWPAASLYIAGNVAPPRFTNPERDNWPMYRLHYAETWLDPVHRRDTPLPSPPIPVTLQSAGEAYESVLADVGANARLDCDGQWVAAVDSIDQRLLQQVREGSGPAERPPASVEEAGGFAQIDPGVACPDSDHDGMPDAWEASTGVLNPNVDDAAGYDLDDLYTNIEVFLNGPVESEVE
jgi:pectate lyase